jgi:hypothetical protein
MPFTFAHPAAVLPFVRYKKYFHIPAMVLGSMAPDFEYFLRGVPVGLYGHTFWGALLFDLPLAAIVWLIGRYIVFEPVTPYLPGFLRIASAGKTERFRPLSALIFIYSALAGIFTHIAWDSFTHLNGAMVNLIPALRETVRINAYEIPVFKFLQHGSTLAGFIVIAVFLLYAEKRRAADARGNKTLKAKILFWAVFACMALSIFAIWFLLSAVSVADYGVIVVRLIDSVILGLLLISLTLRLYPF